MSATRMIVAGSVNLDLVAACETLPKPGETVTNMNPGGGGYGDPRKRPVEKVVADIRLGLVSLEGARRDYGVVIEDEKSLKVDLEATRKLRAA